MRIWLVLLVACSSPKPDWNRKDAAQYCAGAIDAYPGEPAPPCDALRMCANEARLSSRQTATLYEMLAQAGCPAP